MSDIKDGGPAFPTSEYEKGTDRLISGMTLLDYFAGQAMVSIIGKDFIDGIEPGKVGEAIKIAAGAAYAIAYAMIQARPK